jgi:hypothetical protein
MLPGPLALPDSCQPIQMSGGCYQGTSALNQASSPMLLPSSGPAEHQPALRGTLHVLHITTAVSLLCRKQRCPHHSVWFDPCLRHTCQGAPGCRSARGVVGAGSGSCGHTCRGPCHCTVQVRPRCYAVEPNCGHRCAARSTAAFWSPVAQFTAATCRLGFCWDLLMAAPFL